MSVLKDDHTCMIRPATIDDAEAVLDIHIDVISEGDYFIAVADEFTRTPEEQRKWVQERIENKRDTLIVAVINGEVVGWIVFIAQERKRLAHTGSFGLMLSKVYRDRGIGRMLVSALLGWAENHPLIEKVSLGVFSTNHRAISLYKSLGFVEEGRKVKEFKFNGDEYIDDILMYKLV